MSLRPLVWLLLICALAVPASADSMAAYASGGKGFIVINAATGLKVQPLPHAFVNAITVSGRLAYVQANDGHVLYGLTTRGVISKKLAGWVNSVKLGEDVAVVQQDGRTILHGLTASAFIEQELTGATEIRVAGRFVVASWPGAPVLTLYGVAGGRIVTGGAMPSIELGHDMAIARDGVYGKMLIALGPDGFNSVSAGETASVGPSRAGNFQQLHAGSR